MFKHKLYLIEILTNTSVGSGDVNFGMVDSLVQKDPVTFLPVFHSSSIKGALKEHMEQYIKSKLSEQDIKDIFGDKEDKPGKVKFYEARLLTLPLRSTIKVYYNCTAKLAVLEYLEAIEIYFGDNGEVKKEVKELNSFIQQLDLNDKEFLIFTDDSNSELEIEDYKKYNHVQIDNKEKLIKKYISTENLAIFNDEIFCEICERSLPVIARNQIGDDNTSKNLFYEEVLPRRSRLWFMLGIDEHEKINNEFEKILTSDLIQFGANASIGYGVTKIKPVIECKV